MSRPETGPFETPDFDAFDAAKVIDDTRALLLDCEAELVRIEAAAAPEWDIVVAPLEALGEKFSRPWGLVHHLLGVRNSDALREAHAVVQPEVVAFSLRMGQSRPIYEAVRALRDSSAGLDATRRRIVDILVRDAEHAGVGLDLEARTRFNVNASEQAEAATLFSNNVLDATKAFGLLLTDAAEVAGLPTAALDLAAQSARAAEHPGATAEQGPWRITLDAPSAGPFLQHARRRDLREAVYRAHITRASLGATDNTELIARLLRLRREQANLLGFSDFAELSLSTKMAPDVGAVEHMLEELRLASWEAARLDLDDLRQLARDEGAPEADDLQPWDVGYWAERLRERRFDYSDEILRPYFSLPRVLDGLFGLAQRLFGITIEPADGMVPVWHSQVRFFRVSESESGQAIAGFFLDPYSRPAEKRGGAWMDDCVGRVPGRLPVAYLICNQTPPLGDRPSLMSFHEVETLFHEFGHGLQHMLTRVDEPMAAGIRNVEWDAVELPSQFMENWLTHRETLLGLARHFETGEPLPEDLFGKICAARTFRAGSDMLRQLYFSVTDLALHHGFDPDGSESVFDLLRRIAAQATLLPPIPEDRFLCSFSHIFAGGYAAGYYSYKWAEVLSADAFAAFEDAGLDDPLAVRETGRRFRDTVLGLGGSRPPSEVFEAFRGRAPSVAALLRHAGLS